MPAVLQWITRILPARYYVSVLKKIFLKGTPTAVALCRLDSVDRVHARADPGRHACVPQEAGVEERRSDAGAPQADADQGIHPGLPRQAHALRALRPADHPDADLRLRRHLRNSSRADRRARSRPQPGEPRTGLSFFFQPVLRRAAPAHGLAPDRRSHRAGRSTVRAADPRRFRPEAAQGTDRASPGDRRRAPTPTPR